MKLADYICKKCKKQRTISVRKADDFPPEIPCLSCGNISKRVFSAPYVICHMGSVGNAANGYTNTGGNIKKTK